MHISINTSNTRVLLRFDVTNIASGMFHDLLVKVHVSGIGISRCKEERFVSIHPNDVCDIESACRQPFLLIPLVFENLQAKNANHEVTARWNSPQGFGAKKSGLFSHNQCGRKKSQIICLLAAVTHPTRWEPMPSYDASHSSGWKLVKRIIVKWNRHKSETVEPRTEPFLCFILRLQNKNQWA